MLKLYLLGRVQANLEGETLQIDTRKALALLIHLANHADTQQRDRLATLFWPLQDQSKARKSLRQALYNLKVAVSENYVNSDRNSVSIVEDKIWLDVNEFLSLIDADTEDPLNLDRITQLSQAVSLYKGEFMQGFTLSDCPEFDDWQFYQGESYRQHYIKALNQLADWYTTQSNYDLAINYLQKLLATDQLNEAVHRELIKVYAWSGQERAAKRHYENCVKILDEELDIEPEEETQQLIQNILDKKLEPPRPAEASISFAASLSLKDRQKKDNLPQRLTSFVGRTKELKDLEGIFAQEDARLVSIIAPGGMGKTRLALAFAAQQLKAKQFKDGVYLVSLGQLSESENIAQAVAEALNLTLVGSVSPTIQITNQLQDTEILLVLDNFEHLLEGSSLVLDLLDASPNLKLLVTSRERLQLPAEWLYELLGLNLEDSDINEQSLSAIHLFEQRAKQVQPSFDLNKDYEHVLAICNAVKGMPLGIELAASWANTMPVEAIASELIESPLSLDANSKLFPERHRTLATVLDYSWRQLLDQEQTVFKKLSLFKGGFSYKAAQDIAKASFKTLAALSNKSLIRLDKGRYEIHELLRQFAFEKLEEDAGVLEKTQEDHSLFYANFMHELEDNFKSSAQLETLRSIALDLENVLVSWDWAIRQENIEVINKIAISLHNYCEMQGRIQLGVSLFDQVIPKYRQWVLKAEDLNPGLTRLLLRQGFMSFRTRNFDKTKELITEVKPRLEELKSVDLTEYVFSLALIMSIHDGFEDAETALGITEQANEFANQLNDPWLQGICQLCLAENFLFRGRYEQSLDYFEQSIHAFEHIGEKRYRAFSLNNLGRAYFGLGRFVEAQTKIREALSIREEFNDQVGILKSRISLAAVELTLKNFDLADLYLQESVEFCLKTNGVETTYCRNLLGRLALNRGNYEDAKAWFNKNTQFDISELDVNYMPYSLNALAYIALQEKSYEQARVFLERSLEITHQTDVIDEKAEALLYMAFLEFEEHPDKPHKAESYYQQALAIAKMMGASPQALTHCILVDWSKYKFTSGV